MRVHLLEALLACATDYAILALDLDGRVTLWNEGARRIMGWSEAEMLGRTAHAAGTQQPETSPEALIPPGAPQPASGSPHLLGNALFRSHRRHRNRMTCMRPC